MEGKIKAAVKGSFKDTNALGNVTVFGVSSVGQVKLNDLTIDAAKVNYDSATRVLKLSGLNDLTKGGAWQSDWTLSWA